MIFARRVFLIAAVYGFIVLLPQDFLEGQIGRDVPPPITHPEVLLWVYRSSEPEQVVFSADLTGSDTVSARLIHVAVHREGEASEMDEAVALYLSHRRLNGSDAGRGASRSRAGCASRCLVQVNFD